MKAIPVLLTAAVVAGCVAPRTEDVRAASAPHDAWFAAGQQALAERRAVRPIDGPARNVILFVGDGIGPTTVAAARIFDGQSRGEPGEENLLSFERFPHVAYAKTYTTDRQVSDSAGTMSAMMTGVKTKSGVLSVSEAVIRKDCASGLAAELPTLGELAKQAGLAVGIVTTSDVTDATPGAVYAHAADRSWKHDGALPDGAAEAGCRDIARQLIEFPYGGGLDLVLGGGRAYFLPDTVADLEQADKAGVRGDGRNLIDEWRAKSPNHRFVWNAQGFDAIAAGGPVLGLFERGKMRFETDRSQDVAGEPSLTEMTAKAIELMSSTPGGYFLVVESARIDHAHHGGNAYRALSETQEFARAVATARAMTDTQDTLIIVTADHGHTLAFQGYPPKGNAILGLASDAAYGDRKPYTTLVYANGRGSPFYGDTTEGRPAPENVFDKDYRQQALVPTWNQTHGGQDTGIYASGPNAHLFGGVVEQNYVFHVIDDALRLRGRAQAAN